MQIAGPFYPPSQFPGGYTANIQGIQAAPDLVRSLALQIIDRCVLQQNGIGGFGTLGLGNLANLVLSTGVTPSNTLPDHWPRSVGFITVQLSNYRSPNRYPGDTDPYVPITIADAVRVHPEAPAHKIRSPSVTTQWNTQAARMSRGGSLPWWSVPFQSSATDQMSYECSADLGSPDPTDCTQIEWNQLPSSTAPKSNTLTVTPESPTFFHSNSCSLAISSAGVSLALTWAQIRAAVASLINFCVQAPGNLPRGGKAFYSAPPHGGGGGAEIRGWNALPPGVNVTVFEQKNGWVGQGAEAGSCAWRAIQGGKGVGGC